VPRRPRPPAAAPAFASAGDAPLSTLPGVGPALAQKFAARGLLRVQDLWLHLPLRYEDRTKLTRIADLVAGVPAQIEARVEAVERGFRWRPMLRVMLTEPPRHTLALRFFHFNAAQAAGFVPGRRVRVYGEPRPGGRGMEIVHPSYRFLSEDDAGALQESLDPVYPTIEGVGALTVAKLVGEALKRLPPEAELELLPRELGAALGLPSLRAALLAAHRPPADVDVDAFLAGRHPARKRRAFE
jgi:ATP-dependent DNA helicase RecG